MVTTTRQHATTAVTEGALMSTAIATTKRTTDPDYPEFPSYEVTTTDGRVFTVRKEFYGDGPSMFTWTVTHPNLGHVGEANTKRRALTVITNLHTPQEITNE